MIKVENSAPEQVLSWVRRNDDEQVFGVFNLSGKPVEVDFPSELEHGRYRSFKTGESVAIDAGTHMILAPWEYQLFATP